MLGWIEKIFRALYPPHLEEDQHPWRQSVFFWLVLLIVIVFGGLALNLGALHKFGINGVAWASDVDQKISAAVESLENKIDETDRKVQASNNTSKAILRALYLPQVRAKVRQRCDTEDPRERSAINVELDRIKAEYRTLSGENFGGDPTCDEV